MVLSTVLWGRAERVDASTWKMNLLGPGHGHASKGEVRPVAELDWPQLYRLCETEDEKDAMCISLYGQMRHEGKVGPPTKSGERGPALPEDQPPSPPLTTPATSWCSATRSGLQ